MSRYRTGESANPSPIARDFLNPDWPVLTSYDGRNLDRIALPLGGIGTGTVSLGGRGDLRDWEIANRAAKGFNPAHTFFAIRAQAEGREPLAKCLEGPLLTPFEGAHGAPQPHAGLPRFTSASFHTAYPFGQIVLTDRTLPLTVRLEAFNPLIPTDPDHSGYPLAVLRFVVRNDGPDDLDVAIAGSIQNFIGRDNRLDEAKGNFNTTRIGDQLTGVVLASNGVDPAAERWGTIALSTFHDGADITTRQAWADVSWADTLLDFWDDFLADGRLDDREKGSVEQPVASVASASTIESGDERTFIFLLGWHFPNRMSWEHRGRPMIPVGNWYSEHFTDAWHVITELARQLPQLEADSLRFVRALTASAIPPVFVEAALSNLSTLRSQTCFRTPDGRFFGWEGCNDTSGSCHGNCTHVWNYEQATAHLFGSLSRSFRDTEFRFATNDEGLMAFRNEFPLDAPIDNPVAAADGQMGCVMKLYRDWKLSGDTGWMRELWPIARKTLAFAWLPGSWDADQDGVMEGCQHNTMDVEYFGPNPEIGFWYLGALRAGEEMARATGDTEFAAKCHDLFQRGSAWMDANLFNGEYYEHELRITPNADDIHPGLRLGSGARNLADPELQIGAGCLADALVGQLMADVANLGALAGRDNLRTTLNSIVKHNFREELFDHFNYLRTYALADESGTINCTWPLGNRPVRPMPYSNEVWTGIEYTLAAQLWLAGEEEAALRVANAVRDRFDGERRNPFNEAECGHHYARAMSSWALVLAATGFAYDGVSGHLRIDHPNPSGPQFWSTGNAWGTLELNTDGTATLVVDTGELVVRTLSVGGQSAAIPEDANPLAGGSKIDLSLQTANVEPQA